MAAGDGDASGADAIGSSDVEGVPGKPSLRGIFDPPKVDPNTIGHNGDATNNGGQNGGEGEPGPKRRGRKPGSKNRPQGPEVFLDLAGLEKMIFSVHSMLAGIAHIPELVIDEKEAHSMAEAMARVSRHYPGMSRISAKSVDHANLLSVLVGVYGSRFMAAKMRKAADKAGKPTAPNVTVLHPAGGYST